jgi:orotidine-5'-phosphate decarboxylase
MNFSHHLRSIQRTSGSLLCIGLDTDPRRMPRILAGSRDAATEFNRRIIDATHDLVCAYKLNLAFYEAMGEPGRRCLKKTLAEIPDGIISIGDAKRGDIGNSAESYASSLFDDYRFTACTVSPYMGEDSVVPFLRNTERGVFILAVTSNPGAKDFQYLNVRGRPLYEQVIAKSRRWNTKKNCGLVVGATRPKELRRVRELAGNMPILIPGIGAQGGDLRSAVRFGTDGRGEMAIINASRSVIYASSGGDFAGAARSEAMKLRDEITRHREKLLM